MINIFFWIIEQKYTKLDVLLSPYAPNILIHHVPNEAILHKMKKKLRELWHEKKWSASHIMSYEKY